MTPAWVLVLAAGWAAWSTAAAAQRRAEVRGRVGPAPPRRLAQPGGIMAPPGATPPPGAPLGGEARAGGGHDGPGWRDPAAWRGPRGVAAVAGFAALAVLHPVLAAAAVAAVVGWPHVAATRRAARAEARAVATLPDAVELLAVAARAGLPAPAAVAAVGRSSPDPWGPALADVTDRAARGERFGDAVGALVDRVPGDTAHPLRAVLRAAADDGADLAAGLERLAADARDLRRRRAEEAARRVPVRLLLPLVACSLPAFALLTIVPIVAGALRSLHN